MKNTRIFGAAIAAFLILIIGKGSKGQESKPLPSKPINIVVILDTSDRVSNEKNPDQLERDIAIVKGIVNLFVDRVLEEVRTQEKDTWLRHSLAFVVPEQPETTPIPQRIIGKSKIWFTNKDRERGAPRVKEIREGLLGTIDKLYQSVENQTEFTGSDIWKWFRASGLEYLKPHTQNYIICISDGYLDFDRSIQRRRPKIDNKTSYIPYDQVSALRGKLDWEQIFESEGYGLLPVVGRDFSPYDVKFLMVEIKLRHMLDLPILKKYWQTWLESMGIKESEFVESQPDPQIVRERITTFISQNQ